MLGQRGVPTITIGWITTAAQLEDLGWTKDGRFPTEVILSVRVGPS